MYGIEVNGKILGCAERNLAQMGFRDRFQPVLGLSYDVSLPEQVDIVVSEIIGNLGDNEDCFNILTDARTRFLKPKGQMLPEKLTTFLVPVSSLASHRQIESGCYRGLGGSYDLKQLQSQLHTVNPFNLYYDVALPKHTYLSSPQEGFSFNFSHDTPDSTYLIRLSFPISKDGIFTGFKGYFSADLASGIVLDTGGDDIEQGAVSDSWKHCYLPLQQPLSLQQGDVVHFEYERLAETRTQSRLSCRYAWRGTITRDGQDFARFAQVME